MPRLPAIISDIDGVLIRGKNALPGASDVIAKIIQLNLPFVCLTNGGGMLEKEKATQMNTLLDTAAFRREHFILNFTPLRPLI
jgi:ribonucleotide monophosphatase NagD (HAD superfamily)